MNLSFKTTLSGAALLLTSLLTPALAETAPSDTQAQIEQSGTLRVGMSTFAPWAMRDKQGALIGFEIDVARRLATDNGWQVEFVKERIECGNALAFAHWDARVLSCGEQAA